MLFTTIIVVLLLFYCCECNFYCFNAVLLWKYNFYYWNVVLLQEMNFICNNLIFTYVNKSLLKSTFLRNVLKKSALYLAGPSSLYTIVGNQCMIKLALGH
jgi:hypothetical protein